MATAHTLTYWTPEQMVLEHPEDCDVSQCPYVDLSGSEELNNLDPGVYEVTGQGPSFDKVGEIEAVDQTSEGEGSGDPGIAYDLIEDRGSYEEDMDVAKAGGRVDSAEGEQPVTG